MHLQASLAEAAMLCCLLYQKIKPEIDMLSLLAKTDKLRWAIDRSPDRIEHYQSIVKNKLSKLGL